MADKNSENKKEESEMIYEEEDGKTENSIKKLRKKLEECRKQKEEYLIGWQRAKADFINYKRRQEEQAAEWSKTFGEGLIKDLLPVLDSLDAAFKAKPKDEGLKTLTNQLRSILKKHGLEEIKSIGEKFNPEYHEVIECEEGDKGHKAEIIAQEIQKGYFLNGKLLRAAKVKIKK